jgi:hypothetical protein
MAKITAEEHQEFPTLPADSIVFLKVGKSEVKAVAGRNGDSWQKLEFTFKLMGIQTTGDGSPVDNYDSLVTGSIWGSVPFRLTDSPENRLKQWVEAILGLPIEAGFELDTDYLNGREVRGVTGNYNKRVINQSTGLPYQGHQIESLLVKGTNAAPVTGGWGAQSAQAADPFQPAAQPVADPWAQAQPAAAGQSTWDEEPPF